MKIKWRLMCFAELDNGIGVNAVTEYNIRNVRTELNCMIDKI